MATPKLKTAGAPAAPTRLLRPSGAAPAKQIKLKSATGKTIEPKKAPAPKPVASTPAPEEEVITPQPVAEAAPAPIEAAPVTPEPETPAVEEIPVAETPAEEAPAATTDADEEAMRLAQEEYERQMEEYNRQLEEYNRQMAALQAAEATAEAAPVAEEQPAQEEYAEEAPAEYTEEMPEATEEEAPAAPRKKKAKKRATISAEEMAQVQAMLAEEQKQPIWKTIPFMVGCGLLVVTIGICTVMVVQKQAEDARIQAHIEYTNSLLRRAQEINMKGVETQADAAKKGVSVDCTMEDAKALMEVVVDPFVLGENGKPRYGARAEGVAQNACLLLGLAAEKDNAIRDMIFDTMGKKCNVIKPTLFNWLLQRIAITDAKGVNDSLKKLSKTVSEKKTAKPWAQKTQILAHIWECIGLRVTEADVKEIIDLLKDESTDAKLTTNLCICLDNILEMMDSEEDKARVGDEIFNALSDKLRSNNDLAGTLGRAGSTAALEYHKKEIEAKGWTGVGPTLIGCWSSDDILDYVLEQKEANSSNAKVLSVINDVIGTIMKQNRPRPQETADRLISMCFENPFGDTSGLKAIIFKTDPDSIEYVGDSNPELPALKEQQKELEDLRKQKQRVIKVLATLCDHDWVVNTLKKYSADKDEDIKYEADQALERVHANGISDAQKREDYKSRSKD